MRRLSVGISLMAVATLIIELSLIRVFDVLFYPNLAYMIITSAIFAIGLAGIYTVLRPLPANEPVEPFLAKRALLFSIAALAIMPVTNLLPFDFFQFKAYPIQQLFYFAGIYFILVLTFFLAGLVFTNLFAAYAKRIQTLYFWDLAGAAIGSVIIIPLLPVIGPGGIMFFAAGLGLFASALFWRRKIWSVLATVLGLLLFILPFTRSEGYYDFKEHQNKRGVKSARETGLIEYSVWDPISKIDVMYDPINYDWFRYIAYDGGTQTSTFYAFDGDFQYLRANIAEEMNQFWQRGVLASHYLKQDTDQKVLVIGSAGGQEVKAALMYGASHVDGIELVGAVVELGKTRYSQYIGNLFHHPNVNIQVGEGRSFLRASRESYDIIQIFSNHTSSSIASGTGVMSTTYLQTSDAYREYFEHLKEDGILHINHHFYPRMITTAALAWSQMGRTNFQQHVVVFEREGEDTLPTFMVKMQPWTEAELAQLKDFFFADFPSESNVVYRLVEDPLHPNDSYLSPEFYTGELSSDLIRQVDFNIEPSTDNKPYFNFLRRKIGPVEVNPSQFMSESIALPLNNFITIKSFSIPLDIATLIITGTVSLFFAGLFLFLPLFFSDIGRSKWTNKTGSLLYFSCLGAGFIIIEFVFIQVFMKLIGSPLYTSSTVIFMLLFSAGIGSFMTGKLDISPAKRWQIPFLGILAAVLVLILTYQQVFDFFLASHISIRILVASLLIFPLGFFLGMPFPLGILSLANQPRSAVAWAWGMNGLFTVIGGLLGVIVSILWGFQATLLSAFSLYIIALFVFAKIRWVPVEDPIKAKQLASLSEPSLSVIKES